MRALLLREPLRQPELSRPKVLLPALRELPTPLQEPPPEPLVVSPLQEPLLAAFVVSQPQAPLPVPPELQTRPAQLARELGQVLLRPSVPLELETRSAQLVPELQKVLRPWVRLPAPPVPQALPLEEQEGLPPRELLLEPRVLRKAPPPATARDCRSCCARKR